MADRGFILIVSNGNDFRKYAVLFSVKGTTQQWVFKRTIV